MFKFLKRDFKSKRVHFFAMISASKDFIWGFAKLVLAFVASSFFLGFNALFSFGLGTTRVFCLKNRHSNLEKQKRFFKITGLMICVCSLIYILYSIRLFFVQETIRYGLITSIAIAAFTFFEFGLNIYDFIKYKNDFTPATHAIKFVSLCSTLTCFVLTQIALTTINSSTAGMWNGVLGVIIGVMCFGIGLYMSLKRFKNSEIDIQRQPLENSLDKK